MPTANEDPPNDPSVAPHPHPAAVIDVPHFCAEAGHALLATAEEDGAQVYLIRKG